LLDFWLPVADRLSRESDPRAFPGLALCWGCCSWDLFGLFWLVILLPENEMALCLFVWTTFGDRLVSKVINRFIPFIYRMH
jgi:hypothetical protein